MKKIFYTLFVCFMVISTTNKLEARVWTVSNNLDSPGQFTDLQIAINDDNVADNDTLYISGSITTYGNINLNKKLCLLGTGHHPKKEMALVSMIGDISLQEKNALGVVSNTATGSTITGIVITGTIADQFGASNIEISNCQLSHITLNSISTNWKIRSNVIGSSGIEISNSTNIIIQNNIFHAWSYFAIRTSSSASELIDHNLFLISPDYGSGDAFRDVSFAIVTNNIFYGIPPNGLTKSTINNNLTAIDLPYGDNTGTVNIKANPTFVYVTTIDAVFDWNFNYRLKATSAGKGKATDGTDIGPYGGTSPLSDTGEPNIPTIMQANILNPSLPQNGMLNIKLKARINK